MSEAQKEILKMLSDNVISVDEAERLLKALNEGEKRKEESKSRAGGARSITSVLESVGEAFAEIGPMVKSTVEDAITGLLGDDLGDLHEEGLEDVDPVEGKYRIEEGTRMVIVNTWKGGSGKGDLFIKGVDGNLCRIEDENLKSIRVRQDSSHFVLQWSGGPLKVEVPGTVTMLRVRTRGGDIKVKQFGSKMNVKTLGGNLEMFDLLKDFKAKTMGGSINLCLSKGWQGKGQAHTMGGNMKLSIPADVSLKAEAATMGGTIKVDKDIRQSENKQFFPGKSSVNVQIGEESTDSFIALKTMGGDIELRKVQDEDK